jgi:predicted site-specific integrase-resolvase
MAHLTTQEVADRLQVSPRTLRQWRQIGVGPPYIKLGDSPQSECRYPEDALEAWLAGRKVRNTPPDPPTT